MSHTIKKEPGVVLPYSSPSPHYQNPQHPQTSPGPSSGHPLHSPHLLHPPPFFSEPYTTRATTVPISIDINAASYPTITAQHHTHHPILSPPPPSAYPFSVHPLSAHPLSIRSMSPHPFDAHPHSSSMTPMSQTLSPLHPAPAGLLHQPSPLIPTRPHHTSPRNRRTGIPTSFAHTPRTNSRRAKRPTALYPKKRVNIACEVCRGRKTRCDAARPRCSFCASANAICHYRRDENVVPSRDDSVDTVNIEEMEMLARLDSINRRLDTMQDNTQRSLDEILRAVTRLSQVPSSSTAMISEVPEASTLIRHELHQSPLPTGTVPSSESGQSYHAHTPSVSTGSNGYPQQLSNGEPLSSKTNRGKVKILGFHLNGLTCIAGNPTPPELAPMYVGEKDVEGELAQWTSTENHFFAHNMHINPDMPFLIFNFNHEPLEPHIESFMTHILPWFPIISPEYLMQLFHTAENSIKRATENNHRLNHEESLDVAFIMFVAALGQLSCDSEHFEDAPEHSLGRKHFHVGDVILSRPAYGSDSLRLAHCYILKSIYLQMSLRPLKAYEAISHAAHTMQILIRMPSYIKSSIECNQVNNAFWACYLIEHSLQIFVSWSSQTLQETIVADAPRLPQDDTNTLASFWFNAAITLQRTFSSLRPQVAWTQAETLYQPVIALEISKQLKEWQGHLPEPLKFSVEDDMVVQKTQLMQAQFLRAQYYSLQATIHWPMVVRMLTPGSYEPSFYPPGENEPYTVKIAAKEALKYSLMHLRAVIPMMQKRHAMILSNISMVFCMSMFLLCTHNVPVLADIYPEGAGDTIVLAWQALTKWESNPSVAIRANMVAELLRRKERKLRNER